MSLWCPYGVPIEPGHYIGARTHNGRLHPCPAARSATEFSTMDIFVSCAAPWPIVDGVFWPDLCCTIHVGLWFKMEVNYLKYENNLK